MVAINDEKYVEELLTPVLLFDCALSNGEVKHWSTHAAQWQSTSYEARVMDNSGFEIGLLAGDGADWGNRLTIALANTDGAITQLHRDVNLKGCRLTVWFSYLDVDAGTIQATPEAVFTGIGDAPESLTTTAARLSFTSRFALQRLALPQVRIQQSCPWAFPRTATERAEAVNGGSEGNYSRFYSCGYSADQAGGCGNLQGDGSPYTSCGHTRADCQMRGMWKQDSRGNATARFGGFDFLPATSLVRSSGSSQRYWSQAVDGRARSNDAVPLVYGTVRFPAPVIWAWSDGNYVLCEALVSSGPIEGIVRVWANGIELPCYVAGTDMSATGWYEVLSTGQRNGTFNENFKDGAGEPLGDPHGSLAVVSVHVPTSMVSSRSLPTIEVLAQGIQSERFNPSGTSQGSFFTSNPVWALVDLLRRCGWKKNELDLASCGASATALDEPVTVTQSDGSQVLETRAAISYALLDRKPASDVLRSIRQGAELLLRLNANGALSMMVEGTLATQQPTQIASSNATASLNGGWPAFEANDGSTGRCTILADTKGDIAFHLSCDPTSQVANRLTVEYQDSRNDYLNGSLSLIDLDDIARAGSEVAGIFRGVGIPTTTQARRVLSKELARNVDGNLIAEFTTTVMGFGMRPGDLIAITSADYGLNRAPFRVLRLTPGLNYETVTVLAQAHDDGWYEPSGAVSSTSTGWPSSAETGAPFPIAGVSYDPDTGHALGITEISEPQSDGGASELLCVQFHPPTAQVAALAPPVINSEATIGTGTLAPGPRALYYGVTAVDTNGMESRISRVVQVRVGALTAPYGVVLNGIAGPTGATALRIYRGATPYDLLHIADTVATATSYTDSGAVAEALRPPDARYDHANFYWRTELTGEIELTGISGQALSFVAGTYTNNQFTGNLVRVVSGAARGWEATVVSNTTSSITISEPVPTSLTNGDKIVVTDASWRYAGRSYTDQHTWEIPNRAGVVLEIVARSATADGLEAPLGQSFLTRHLIVGAAGILTDSRVPPQPNYVVSAPADGSLVLEQLSVPTLIGTTSVDAALLVTYSSDESVAPTTFTLAAGLIATDLTMLVTSASPLTANTYFQLGAELLRVVEPGAGLNVYVIDRALSGSTSAAHDIGSEATVLEQKLHVIPLGSGFFADPSHQNFQSKILFPNRRVAATNLLLRNSRGTGLAQSICHLTNGQNGLHTYAGGTIVLQTLGVISIETDATGTLTLDRTRVVRDIQAFVDTAPTGGTITLYVRADGTSIATLVVADGATHSGVFVPASALVLQEGTRLTVDVTGVPQATNSYPGKNLTVQVRT